MNDKDDDTFFERYSSLFWKRENFQRKLISEAEEEKDKPFKTNNEKSFAKIAQSLTPSQKEMLYFEVLYTIKHKIGKSRPGDTKSTSDLYDFAKEAFHISDGKHEEILTLCDKENAPTILLHVEIVEARDLEAKDVNGLSDPYCMLGIRPKVESSVDNSETQNSAHMVSGLTSDELEVKKPSQRSFSITNTILSSGLRKRFSKENIKTTLEKERSRSLIPAKFIYVTSVKEKLLILCGKKSSIEDINTETLHIDIWDHDDEANVYDAAKKLNQIIGIKGVGRYFKQIVQSSRTNEMDDFLGSVDIFLDKIPSTGSDFWYELQGRTSRSNIQGKIHVILMLGTREDRGIVNEDFPDFLQHQSLIEIFIKRELHKLPEKEMKYLTNNRSYKKVSRKLLPTPNKTNAIEKVYKHINKGDGLVKLMEYIPEFMWSGKLPSAAVTILHQHAIQSDINHIDMEICKWKAYCSINLEFCLDYNLLLKILQNLDYISEEEIFSRDQEAVLAVSFNGFIENCLVLITNMRIIFHPYTKAALARLERLLNCLQFLYAMKLFKRSCPFAKNLSTEVITALKKGIIDWYEQLSMEYQMGSSLCAKLVRKMYLVNFEMETYLTCYNSLFKTIINVSCISIVFKQIDKMIAEEVQNLLKQKKLLVNEHTVSSYINERDSLEGVNNENVYCRESWVELFLALEQINKYCFYLSENEKNTSSMFYFSNWFFYILHSWMLKAKKLALKRIENIIRTKTIHLCKKDKVISQYCQDFINCFCQVKECFQNIMHQNQLPLYALTCQMVEIICFADKTYSTVSCERTKNLDQSSKNEKDNDSKEKICETMNGIVKFKEILSELEERIEITECIESIKNTSGESIANHAQSKLEYIKFEANDMIGKDLNILAVRYVDKAVERTILFLDAEISSISNILIKDNLLIILKFMLSFILTESYSYINESCDKSIKFYERLYDFLGILKDFFHGNGEGLPLKEIKTEQYLKFKKYLYNHKLPTQDLIDMYYFCKIVDQEMKEGNGETFGCLEFKVVFNTYSQKLYIKIIGAKDLPPLDRNGLSDPFVSIAVLPHNFYTNVAYQKTKIAKKTLSPQYDEVFEFSICEEEISAISEDAAPPKKCNLLHFVILDYDNLFHCDFSGEAFYSLNQVERVNVEDEELEMDTFDSIFIMMIKSEQYTDAWNTLQDRSQSDKLALNFSKFCATLRT